MQFKNVNFPAGYLWAFSLPPTLSTSPLCLSPSRPVHDPPTPPPFHDFLRFWIFVGSSEPSWGKERKFDDSTAQLKFNVRWYVAAYNSCATIPLIQRILRNEIDYRRSAIKNYFSIYQDISPLSRYTVVHGRLGIHWLNTRRYTCFKFTISFRVRDTRPLVSLYVYSRGRNGRREKKKKKKKWERERGNRYYITTCAYYVTRENQ